MKTLSLIFFTIASWQTALAADADLAAVANLAADANVVTDAKGLPCVCGKGALAFIHDTAHCILGVIPIINQGVTHPDCPEHYKKCCFWNKDKDEPEPMPSPSPSPEPTPMPRPMPQPMPQPRPQYRPKRPQRMPRPQYNNQQWQGSASPNFGGGDSFDWSRNWG
ncbi:hypothetical protein CP532_4806 [Ophiocordyceps camponoti-leonardi (nom. inval.)]|nr:hypothetical protein CP532_4806 [Ophiocordyceps camponoti-leonardi (nom. inval.)]